VAVRSEGLKAYFKVLEMISRGHLIDTHEIVLEDDRHYYRFADDESLDRVVSARLMTSMCRQRLVKEGRYWEITRRGRDFMSQGASFAPMVN
jgi:hypothetical protein